MKLPTKEQYQSWQDRLHKVKTERAIEADWSHLAEWMKPYSRLMEELQQECEDFNVTSNAGHCARTLADLRTAKRQTKIDRCEKQMRWYESSLDGALAMHLQDYTPTPRHN